MSRHALYLWGAYGVFALLVLAEALLVLRRHRRALRRAQHDDTAKDDAR
jgi:heme exporter protein CcmD